jgi:hypothetical protein
MKKVAIRIYRVMPKDAGFWQTITEFEATGSSRYFGLGVVFREACDTDALQFWYLSMYIHAISFRVECERGLSISILKNKATFRKSLQLESK